MYSRSLPYLLSRFYIWLYGFFVFRLIFYYLLTMGTYSSRTSQSVLRRCLFTLNVLVSLVSVTRAQAPSGDVQCNTAPPGVVKIFKGVDITSLDLLPTDFTADDGFKSPVLNFTCNQQNKVYVRGDQRYQIPDQVRL